MRIKKQKFESSIGTKISLLNYGNISAIQKEIKLNKIFFGYEQNLLNLINIYMNQLNQAGISVPPMFEMKAQENSLIFLCKYAGESIFELMSFEKLHNTILYTNIFSQILKILKKAQKNNIAFDPHPKNYVILDGNLSYIDLTPPYSEEYFELRISKAQRNEIEILKNFFDCMMPEELGYHLAGDILKMNKKNITHMPLMFEKMLENEIIDNSYELFLEKAQAIINKEKTRENKNIILM